MISLLIGLLIGSRMKLVRADYLGSFMCEGRRLFELNFSQHSMKL